MAHQHHAPMGNRSLLSPAQQDPSSQRAELSLQWRLPGTGSHSAPAALGPHLGRVLCGLEHHHPHPSAWLGRGRWSGAVTRGFLEP